MADKITVGVIGSGRIGKLHITNLVKRHSDIVVKKVADVNIDAAQDWLADLGITETTTDYREVLDDPAIQAVFILSSTSTHAQFSIEAAQAGKDIFCEKPIDYDIPRIHEVLRVVEQAGVKYQIGFNRRFDHNFRRIREVVTSGQIGDVHIVKVCARDPGYNIDYIRESAKAGGILYDMTIHDLDMARFISGMDVEEVYVSGGAIFDPEIGEAGDADTIVVLLKFKGGAMGIIDNSRQALYGYDQRVEVFGSAGMAITPNDRPSLVEVYTKEPPTTDKIHYFFLERYNQAFIDEEAEFFASIRENRPPSVSGIDGLNAVLIAAAGKKSLEEHRPVALSEVDSE
ncbi:MAG TPA: inositol 2-dehydrogenase [Candidatus Lokiarchaeia archaeon]|nr:inositol 2-dehydrogenase [Candidatus Lokiarchaeia archaeon]